MDVKSEKKGHLFISNISAKKSVLDFKKTWKKYWIKKRYYKHNYVTSRFNIKKRKKGKKNRGKKKTSGINTYIESNMIPVIWAIPTERTINKKQLKI